MNGQDGETSPTALTRKEVHQHDDDADDHRREDKIVDHRIKNGCRLNKTI